MHRILENFCTVVYNTDYISFLILSKRLNTEGHPLFCLALYCHSLIESPKLSHETYELLISIFRIDLNEFCPNICRTIRAQTSLF